MDERLRKARRLLAVQLAIERLAAWTVVDLECRDAELQDRRRDLVRFLDGETAFAGVFPVMMMRHLQDLAEKHAALVVEKDTRAELLRQERARLRIAERITQSHASDDRKNEEAGRLLDVIEADVEQRRIRQRQG